MGEAARTFTDEEYTQFQGDDEFDQAHWVRGSVAQRKPVDFVFDVPIGAQVVRVTGNSSRLPEQLSDVVESFARMALLQEGWDSYGAESIRPAAMKEAFSLILTACRYGLAPELAPTPSGGVQIEWEHFGREFDVRVEGPGEYHAYYLDTTGEEWDPGRKVTNDEIEHHFEKLKFG